MTIRLTTVLSPNSLQSVSCQSSNWPVGQTRRKNKNTKQKNNYNNNKNSAIEAESRQATALTAGVCTLWPLQWPLLNFLGRNNNSIKVTVVEVRNLVYLCIFFFWVLLILVYELFKLVHTSQSVFRSKICMYVLLTLIGRVSWQKVNFSYFSHMIIYNSEKAFLLSLPYWDGY